MPAALFQGCGNIGENCTATLYEALHIAWSPRKLQTQMNGSVGLGLYLDMLPSLLPSVLLSVLLYFIRAKLQTPLVNLGRYLGIREAKLMKFQNQAWLAIYYVLSTSFGYYTLRNEPYFRFPVRATPETPGAMPSGVAMWNRYPYPPNQLMLFYYNCAIAFYLTEVTTLCTYCKRTDFLEYVLHHIYTLTLLIFSHLGYYHRIGVYTIFIHDASDIMLCVGKMLDYCRIDERLGACVFLCFIASFAFFRLYVLLGLVVSNWGLAAKLMPFSYSYMILTFVLHVLLQSLHIYWFGLIIRIALRTIGFTRVGNGQRRATDVRSSGDDEDEVAGEVVEQLEKLVDANDQGSSGGDILSASAGIPSVPMLPLGAGAKKDR